jgi:hypothetical protein
MRVIPVALLIAGTLAVVAPASAEDVFVGGRVGGVGVGVDVGEHHDGFRYRDGFRHRDRVITERRVYRDDFARARCRTVIIHEGNMTKKIRKCRD